MTKVVLLGAGASFGSGPSSPNPPPLGKDVFKCLVARGGIAATLPKSLSDVFEADFEAGMAEFILTRRGDESSSFQHELAEFLASFKPLPENLYLRLLRLMKPSSTLFCTLNYDLMFEWAAIASKLNVAYQAEGERGYVRLLKLHGSSNFWPDVGSNVFNGQFDAPIYIKADVECLHPNDLPARFARPTTLSPVMAFYAKGKDVKVCPDFVKEQQRQWVEAINRASKVFVIGVRVIPEDDHIWDPLGRSAAPVHYFGSIHDKAEFDAWKSGYPKRNLYFHKGYFSEALNLIPSL